MTFNSTNYTAPSGSFVEAAGFRIGDPLEAVVYRPIHNPSVLNEHTESFEVANTFSYLSNEWFASLSGFPCRVADSDFDIREGNAQFKKQHWVLDLNLLHDDSARTNIGNIEAVKSFATPGAFEIELHRYPVTNLIVEDYDPALAVKLESDGQTFRFKPCAVPGSFLYQVGSEVRLIESEDCYRTFEKLYSDSITQYLLTSDRHEQDGVVWQEYQNK
jgi:hypothetical protein